ncbi:MAG: histidine kinase [Flavobacterium sp.]|nr:histidine kinase [Flavobacterium sp.]
MNIYMKEFGKSVLLGCGIFVILMLFRVASGGSLTWNYNLLINFGYTMLYSVLLYLANALVFIGLDKYYKHERFPARRLFVGFLISFLVTIAIIFLLRIFEDVIVEGKTFSDFIAQERLSNYLVAIILFFFITLGIHAFYFYKAYQENKVKEQKIIAGTASAKFESLKNQIDPHFLFNSLNVLSSLIEENPENAQKFTTSLSKIYRYVLEQKDKELVSLEEELSFARTYMNLLKMRFENSLFYEMPDGALNPDAKVVPLSLQLLLENTVKHNVVSEKKPLTIRIKIEGDYLVVENDLQRKEILDSRRGVGLQNIINRYAIITSRSVMIDESDSKFRVLIPILTKQIRFVEPTGPSDMSPYITAQKKVDDIKGFYGNLGTYIIVILGIAIVNLVTYPKFLWFLFPAVGWGIGVAIHGVYVFNLLPFLGSEWEEKKIKELMSKEKSKEWK